MKTLTEVNAILAKNTNASIIERNNNIISKALQAQKELNEELAPFGYETEAHFGIEKYDDEIYIQDHFNLVISGTNVSMMSKNSYHKYYRFFPTVLFYSANIDAYQIREAEKSVNEPNNVGVLSKRKIEEWLTYYREREIAIRKKISENDKVREDFIAEHQAKNIPLEYGKDFVVEAEVIKNGLKYYARYNKSGYVSTKIEVHYKVDNNLTNFLKLSNNEYK